MKHAYEELIVNPTVSLSAKGGILLTLPSFKDAALTSSIEIPPTEAGMKALLRVLRTRAKEERSYIGTAGHPTAEQVKAWLAAEAEALRKPVALAVVDLDLGFELDL